MTVNDELRQLYRHADEVEAFEHEAAESVTAPLRAQLQEVSRWLAQRWVREFGSLRTEADPAALSGIISDLRARLAGLSTDHSGPLRAWARRALALGIEQAAREINTPVSIVPRLGDDTARSVARVSAAMQDRLRRADRLLTVAPGRTHDDVMRSVAMAHGAVSDLERASRWVTNREVNNGSSQLAEQLDAGLLWVAERTGCVHCLAYSGVVADHGRHFPPDLSFGDRPLKPWPDGLLDRPPLHPHCRCRVTPWLGHDGQRGGPTALPEVLKREARRSVLRGWSLDSEPESVRLAAADRLLRQGANLPRTVEDRARAAVRRGHFASRDS